METELRHESDKDMATSIAFHSAANALSVFEGSSANGLRWPLAGNDDSDAQDWIDLHRQETAAALAAFVRQNPTAPPESLFRYAAGQGIHAADVDGFGAPELMGSRVAYAIFFETLRTADRVIAEERAAAKAREQAERGPILAAALQGSPDGTALEPLPDPHGPSNLGETAARERAAEKLAQEAQGADLAAAAEAERQQRERDQQEQAAAAEKTRRAQDEDTARRAAEEQARQSVTEQAAQAAADARADDASRASQADAAVAAIGEQAVKEAIGETALATAAPSAGETALPGTAGATDAAASSSGGDAEVRDAAAEDNAAAASSSDVRDAAVDDNEAGTAGGGRKARRSK